MLSSVPKPGVSRPLPLFTVTVPSALGILELLNLAISWVSSQGSCSSSYKGFGSAEFQSFWGIVGGFGGTLVLPHAGECLRLKGGEIEAGASVASGRRWPISHHSLERSAPFGSEPGAWFPSRACRALQDLLVSDLCVCAPPWIRCRGGARPDSGLFAASAGSQGAAAG